MVRAKAKEEAVQLVRSLPCTESKWLKARWGRARRLRAFGDCLAEMRESALMVYKAPGVEKTDKEAEKIAGKPIGSHIEMFPLREAQIVSVPKSLTITVRKPDLSGTVDLRFSDKTMFDSWALQLKELSALRHVTLADFEIDRHVGKGASGRVYLVRDKETREELALKVIEKVSVFESADSYRHALDERIVLELATKHPFILDMRFAFQNRERLFLVTEYCGGGDLFEYLNKKSRPMDESKARYVTAEILLAIEHVHKLGAVYRDLKLENVLLDTDGHVRVADFGLSKLLARNAKTGEKLPPLQLTKTFCGTREYVAPEMLSGGLYDTSVDLWAFGILLYEILCGRTPFYSRERNEIYERIEKAPVFYPKDMSEDVQDLLKGLLERDVSKRLGAGKNGIADIKAHPWFAVIDWGDLYAKKPHVNSIASEIRQMNCGKGNNSSPTAASKKTKRQIAQERAMETLMSDCASDVEAMGKASPRTMNSTDGDGAPSGLKTPKVLPVGNTRKKAAIVAGYSFLGRPALAKSTPAESSGEGGYSGGQTVYRNPSEGFERGNIFDENTTPSSGVPASLEDSLVTEETVPEKSVPSTVHRLVPGLGKMGRNSDEGGGAFDLLSPASPSNLDDLADKIVETCRESNAAMNSSTLPSPTLILKRRHKKKMEHRKGQTP
jgi:serine/threonine protein kinase